MAQEAVGLSLQAMRAQHARTRTQGRGTEQSRVTQKDATSLKIPPDPIVKVRKKYAKKTRLMEKTRTVKTYYRSGPDGLKTINPVKPGPKVGQDHTWGDGAKNSAERYFSEPKT